MQDTTILVIGNGFDLQCGLKTSFRDFLKDRQEKYKDFYNQFSIDQNEFIHFEKGNYESQHKMVRKSMIYDFVNHFVSIDTTRLNVWEIIFAKKYIQNESFVSWVDVEGSINEFLESDSSIFTFNSISKHLFNMNLEEEQYFQSEVSTAVISRLFYRMYYTRQLSKVIESFVVDSVNSFKKALHYSDENELRRFFLIELNRFERDFQYYVMDQVAKREESYDRNARSLFHDLTWDDESKHFYLMNFNYTLPRVKEMNGNGTNVHGYIGSFPGQNNDVQVLDRIIVGIDLSRQRTNTKNYSFTKTYRKLAFGQSIPSQPLPPKEKVGRIVFYGHSLGDADYSYFQSLFDFYDIYSGVVTLDFQYTIYDDDLYDEILSRQQFNVSKLVNSYGGTMSNPEWGKNLLHKLLLEHRIRLTETPNHSD